MTYSSGARFWSSPVEEQQIRAVSNCVTPTYEKAGGYGNGATRYNLANLPAHRLIGAFRPLFTRL